MERGLRGERHLEYLQGNFWYLPVKAYSRKSPAFDSMSDWGDEGCADRRFHYATRIT